MKIIDWKGFFGFIIIGKNADSDKFCVAFIRPSSLTVEDGGDCVVTEWDGSEISLISEESLRQEAIEDAVTIGDMIRSQINKPPQSFEESVVQVATDEEFETALRDLEERTEAGTACGIQEPEYRSCIEDVESFLAEENDDGFTSETSG